MTDISMLRLWQLISPALPVGAYAYSGGLESAVERGYVHDRASCLGWVMGILKESLTYVDLPMFVRLYQAWAEQDLGRIEALSQQLQAMRESQELLAEDRQMGAALRRLLIDLGVRQAEVPATPSFATMYALACLEWGVDCAAGAQGLGWSWTENQIAAAIKLVPLGQTDGQRLLGDLMPEVVAAVETALDLDDDEVGRSLPGLAILSAQHEEQYSRLFRS
jgi:urease accessory protein